MNIVIRLSLLILPWVFTLNIQAQTANCVDFSEFESGVIYGQQQGNVPGDLIYSNQGLNLYIDQLYNFNGSGSFGQMSVESDLGFGSEPPYLLLSGVSASFEIDGAASTVCYTTTNNGTSINFGVNGGVGIFSSIADPSIMDSFPDVDITISNFDDTPFDPIIVCISGNIEQFSIGGDGIFLDNVCTDYFPDPNCNFSDPDIQAYCLSADTINLSVNFSEIVGNNDFVDVFLDDEFYGFYPIESFPLNLGNIPFDANQSTIEFSICINDNPNCCYTQSLDLPDCMPESCVGFELFSDEMENAFANDWPYDSVYHVENGIRFTQRQMFRNGQLVPPNGLMLRLAPNAIPAFTSGSFITMGHVSTASQIDLSNYSEPIYSASFDFYRFDDESYMNIGVNGQEVAEPNGPFQAGIGTSTLADGTVRRIHYNSLDPNLGTVEFFGHNITEIFFGGEGVSMDNLCFNLTDCEITDLNVGQFACDPTNPPYRFFLDFDHNHLAQDSFHLQIDSSGTEFGTFTHAYSDLPLTNIELFGSVGQALTFTVADQFFEDCAASFTTELHNCENACADFSASTVEIQCTDPFNYEAVVELSTAASGQTITLIGLTNNYSQTVLFTNGNSVPFSFFEGGNDPEGYTLTDGLTGCQVYLPPFDLSINNCMECIIEYASITPTPCNADGLYSVEVDIIGSNSFQEYYVNIFGDDTYGPFQQEDFPLTVGSLTGNDHVYQVEIFGVEGDCYYTENVSQNCGIQNCNAFFPVITAVECLDNSELVIEVVIEGQTPDERFFLIQNFNGEVLAEVPFTQNPITFTIPNNNTSGGGAFIITDLSNDCQQILQYQAPANCPPFCDEIFNLLEVGCSDDGVPVIYFTAVNPNGDIFFITIDGVTLTRAYGEEIYTVALPVSPGQTVIDIIFEDPATDCSVDFTVDNPCNSCNNFYPNIIGVECTPEIVLLSILLDGEEPDFRELRISDLNGNFITEVLFTQNPFTVTLPLNNSTIGAILIEDTSNGCEQVLQYDLPAGCVTNCEDVFNLLEVDCNNSGEIRVFFTAEGPDGEPFFVIVNGQTYTYDYGNGEYVIELLPDPAQLSYTISFWDELTGCEAIFTFENPCATCNDFHPVIVGVECTPDTVLLSILLDGEEPDFRELRFTDLNGNFITEVLFSQNPFTIALPPNSTSVSGAILIEDSNNGCEQVLQYDIPPGCNTNCEGVFNLLEVDCNSAGEIRVFFAAEGPDGELFFVNVNGQTYTYEYGNGEYVLELLPDPAQLSYTINFWDELTGCEAVFSFENPCATCNDFHPVVIGVECLSPNTNALLTILLDGIEADGREIHIYGLDGNLYEELLFTQNPFTVAVPINNAGAIIIVDVTNGCEQILQYDLPPNCPPNCADFSVDWVDFNCLESANIQLYFDIAGLEPNGQILLVQSLSSGYTIEVPYTASPLQVEWPLLDQGDIRITTNEGCSDITQYITPEQCINTCIDSFALIEVNCNDFNEIRISFIALGLDGEAFTINANGTLFTGIYGEGEYVIAIPSISGQNEYEIVFQDQLSGCVNVFNFTNPCFCVIEDISYSTIECNEQGEWFLELSFVAGSTTGEDEFIVSAGGYTQSFPEGTINTTIGPFINSSDESIIVNIFAANENCEESITIDYGCESQLCDIFDLIVSSTPCDSEGNYFLEVYFEAEGAEFFEVSIENTNISQVVIGSGQTTTLGPLNINEIQTSVILIEAINANCAEEYLHVQECEPEFCDIFDLIVTGSSCDIEGNYFLEVYFEAEGAEFFEVSITNANLSQSVVGSGQTVTFGPLNIGEIQTAVILVEAIDAICAAEYLHVQECQPHDECNFTNIFAEAYACDSDFFLVDIEFDNPFGGPLGFYIFGDGMIFGPYEYGETFYTFGPLDGSNSEHDILILDIADPACFGNYSFNYSCSDDCLIQEVALTPSDCNDDGTFYVTVDVAGSNLGENFSVLGNGQNYGTFSYADLPIEVGPFDGDDESVYELGIIDLDNPNCANWSTFGPINCNPCDIRDFTYEVDCDNNSSTYTLTIDFIYENPASDLFALQIGGEVYEWFSYESLPLILSGIPYEFNGETIRVEDVEEELCGETIDFELPCCSMGNILNELEVEACQDNGEYYLSINGFTGQNLTDSLVVDYAPAGTSIIATVVVAYNDLPTQIGPLVGDGSTGYLVVLSDQINDCSVTTNIEPVFCDNGDCVEFEGENGVFGPDFGYDNGDLITVENEVAITFERNPVTNCECNLFITNGIPGVDFGNGQIVATLNSGFGLNFAEVSQPFNTVNIDYYYPGGGLSMRVNGSDLITVNSLNDLPSSIAGIELQVITDPNNPSIGLFTFNGAIETIQLFSNESAAFDNVCRSTDDNVWPGDTNTDNVASHFDLLNIGLTYGNTGPSRQEVANVWAGLISADWADSFADSVNHKHADANGDGIINEEDRLVLVNNYGLDHGPVSDFEALPYTDLDPPIFVDVSDIDDANPGSIIQVPVIAGSIDQEIVDIYGLAFTIQIAPELFEMGSIQLIYPTSWFGEPGVNTSSIEKIYDDGRIEVAMTRIDHNNVSGFGEIMSIRVIIDDIAGIVDTPADIVLDHILAINHEEERSVLRPEMTQLMITSTTEEMDRDLLRSSFRIFPNPTQGLLHFRNQYGIAPNRVSITDAAGRLVSYLKAPGMSIDLTPYPAGVYFLQIHLEGYIFTERVVKTE